MVSSSAAISEALRISSEVRLLRVMEIFSPIVLEKRKGILDGLAITGGEPLLQKDIRPFIERVRHLGYRIKLDTNGCYPDRLKDLVARAMAGRNLSHQTLNWYLCKFQRLTAV